MIKVTDTSVEVHGSYVRLQAELTVLIKSLLDNGFDKEDIDLCVETATLSEEELMDRTVKRFEDFMNSLYKDLKD